MFIAGGTDVVAFFMFSITTGIQTGELQGAPLSATTDCCTHATSITPPPIRLLLRVLAFAKTQPVVTHVVDVAAVVVVVVLSFS